MQNVNVRPKQTTGTGNQLKVWLQQLKHNWNKIFVQLSF